MQKIAYSVSKYLRVSPAKLSRIISRIRGKTYREALEILSAHPQKPGMKVWNSLKSASSNLAKQYSIEKEKMLIAEAFVNQGTILKRIQPRARGKAFRIEKKFSHITIKVIISTLN